jgi:hypothetical protein
MNFYKRTSNSSQPFTLPFTLHNMYVIYIMGKINGGTSLTQIAVPAALFYANQLFSSNRRKPVPATFKRKTTFKRRRSTKRNFKKSRGTRRS